MGLKKLQWAKMGLNWSKLVKMSQNGPICVIILELTEKWKLTTQNNAYDMEGNKIQG